VFASLLVAFITGSTVPILSQDGAGSDQFGQSLGKSTNKQRKEKHQTSRELPLPNSEPDNTIDDTIRIQTVLTVTDVYVQDAKGSFVGGLAKDDFRLTEDGVPQEISIFSNGDGRPIPRSIVMVIDHSASQLAYFSNSIEAAKIMIGKLPAEDRVAIVTDDVQVLQDYTTDKDRLISKLEDLKKRTLNGELGKSLQYSALYAVIKEKFQGGDLRPVVIFQTDGDQFSTLKGSGYKYELSSFSYQDLVNLAISSGVAIYTINPGASFVGAEGGEARRRARGDLELGASAYRSARKQRPPRQEREYSDQFLDEWAKARAKDESSICQLAVLTGGWAVNIPSPDKAAEAYSRIFEEMNHRYTIGYYPTNQNRDGSLRSIRIDIAGSKYTVRHKPSYLASSEATVQP
jgi:VWFA-related protein